MQCNVMIQDVLHNNMYIITSKIFTFLSLVLIKYSVCD